MKRLLPFAAMLLLVTAIANGQTIRFDPPNATAHHSVDAVVSGVWPDSCVPSVKGITVAGSTILLRLNTLLAPDVGCRQSVTQYRRTFHLEVLPAGVYTVIALADSGNDLLELSRTPLIVRDAETLHIAPYAVPTSGGPIVIDNPFDAAATVNIGDANAPNTSKFASVITANAPPHAAGAVNVAVSASGETETANAALIYYDPAAADPAVFEPILYPMSFQGLGAMGSVWKTENFMLAGGAPAFFRDPLPCSGCTTVLSADAQLFNDDDPWGHVLYAMRGTTDTVDFASRIRDSSKNLLSAASGTEVPIVREGDFRGQLRYVDVPVDGRFRASLRMWSLGDFPEYLVFIGSNPAVPLHTTRIPGTSMWFGSLDITASVLQSRTSPVSITVFPEGFGSPFLPITAPPIWGMLSLTNNVSQQVTIISPH
jgi:hypothetical protein